MWCQAFGASGAVLRNSQGEVLAAMAQAYTNIADVLMAKALTARDVVVLATEHGATKVILRGGQHARGKSHSFR